MTTDPTIELNAIIEGFDRPADDVEPDERFHVRIQNQSTNGEGLLMCLPGGETVDPSTVRQSFVKQGLAHAGWTEADTLTDEFVWTMTWLINANDFAPSDVSGAARTRRYYKDGGCKVLGCTVRSAHYHRRAYSQRITLLPNETTGWPLPSYLASYQPELEDDEQTTIPHYVLLDLDPAKRVAVLEGRRGPRWDVAEMATAFVTAGKGLMVLRYDLAPWDKGRTNGVVWPMLGMREDGTHNLTQVQTIGVKDHDRAIDDFNLLKRAIRFEHLASSSDADLAEAGPLPASVIDEI